MNEAPFLDAYERDFHPAIIEQAGCIECLLFRITTDSIDIDPVRYRLDITFASEAERTVWVSKDLHQAVWGELSALMEDFSVLHLTINQSNKRIE